MNLKEFIASLKKAGLRASIVFEQAREAYSETREEEIVEVMKAEFPEFERKLHLDDKDKEKKRLEKEKADGKKAVDKIETQNLENQNRATEIVELCQIAGRSDSIAEYIKSKKTVEEIRAEILKKRQEDNPPVGDNDINGSRVRIDKGEIDNFREFALGNLLLRSGYPEKKIDKVEDIKKTNGRGLKLMDYARRAYEIFEGRSASLVDPQEILTRALGHSTGDFTNVLADVANKFMAIGYEEARTTYQTWTGRGSIPDFKPQNVIQLSGVTDLEEIPEGEAPKQITMSDAKETATLKTFGGVFVIGRKAIINDDLQAFSVIPRNIAVAGRRKINDLAYGILTDNDNLADGTALFASGHNNVGTGGVVSNTTIGEAVKLFRRQKDPKSNILNLMPRFFIGPATIETATLSVLRGDLPIVHTKATDADVWRGRFDVVFDAVLDEDNTAQWYMASDPTLIDTVTIFFLNGNDAPILTEMDALVGQPLGRSFQIIIDVVAKAIDHRGLMRNVGV